ncbi:PilT protein domain protein [Planktothrix serta PCC 8927]|uniref:PilT protein domain protein n=1 Tax=Planktothrix serta PCC 8927 TaxID=671068 RepID=A0A7Z9BKR9_9CYAN|nr:type II toxin-antitoxin system VapC family toxin [Planktothrix serta]VXD16009.1 PilT protein domain protein [Planktothrix serta PCC 8927]
MTESICLDTSVWIKYLCPDEQSQAATDLVTDALTRNITLIAPGFGWAEIGSVLRKKVRLNLLTSTQSEQLYLAYSNLPINYLDSKNIQLRAWNLAQQYSMSTLYDAVFLACAEHKSAEYWTADEALLRQLSPCPAYVHQLGL